MREDFKRILLIQFRPMGDVLLTTPLISLVRKHYPEAHIAFMVEPAPGQVLENNPDLDEIIYYKKKKDDIRGSLRFFRSVGAKGWDLTIDVYGTPGTAWATLFSKAPVKVGYTVRVRKYVYDRKVNHLQPDRYTSLKKLALIKAVGIEEETSDLTYVLSPEYVDYGKKYFSDNKIEIDRFTVCIAPTCKRRIRMWRMEGWAELNDRLVTDYNARIITVWGPGEEDQVDEFIAKTEHKPLIIPKTSLGEMAGIIQKCDLVISNNTGNKHIADALGLPTITICGSSSPLTWIHPDTKRRRFLHTIVPCADCGLKECFHQSCMEEITTEQIIHEMHQINELDSYFNYTNSGRD